MKTFIAILLLVLFIPVILQAADYKRQSGYFSKDNITTINETNTSIFDNSTFDEATANSAYAVVTSLIECPDTSGAAGGQGTNWGFSISIAPKDPDCAKVRLIQGLASIFPDSPRHAALFDRITCTLDIWREIKKTTGFTCAMFLQMEPAKNDPD